MVRLVLGIYSFALDNPLEQQLSSLCRLLVIEIDPGRLKLDSSG